MPKQLHAFTIIVILLTSAWIGASNCPTPTVRTIVPLAQNRSSFAGQTSVAMCLNAITGLQLDDDQIYERYGFNLLDALNSESKPFKLRWVDAGDLKPTSWELIDRSVNQDKMPVIVALNGAEFSPSPAGHIVTVVLTKGQIVVFADPATGRFRASTKDLMNSAPSHPDGNFVFVAEPVTDPSPLELLMDHFQGER